MLVKGEYKAEGKIAVFPISGNGVYNISMRKDGPKALFPPLLVSELW
jgi:hypothetical protein